MTPTYEQQWQKITEAYMRDEITPLRTQFYFCGTLCDNSYKWHSNTTDGQHNDYKGYEGNDFVRMERALLNKLWELNGTAHPDGENYEQALFEGMVDALEILRQIHLAKGDPTAKEIKLEKRILQTA